MADDLHDEIRLALELGVYSPQVVQAIVRSTIILELVDQPEDRDPELVELGVRNLGWALALAAIRGEGLDWRAQEAHHAVLITAMRAHLDQLNAALRGLAYNTPGPGPAGAAPFRYLTLAEELAIPAGTPNVFGHETVAAITADPELLAAFLPEHPESQQELDDDPFWYPGFCLLIAASWGRGLDFRAAAAFNEELLDRLRAEAEDAGDTLGQMLDRVARWSDADWQRGLGLVGELEEHGREDE